MVDLFLLASLPFGAWRAVMPFVITFLSMDVILAALACILEREPITHAWRILPMRLIYRPMLSYCIWKAILRAVKGAWVSWGNLEQMVGKPKSIIASSTYWGEQSFPTANLNVIWRHGSLPLVFWSPWDKPYAHSHGPDRCSLFESINGKWDAYIDKWGDAARAVGHPIIVAFGVEMNGDWFPWSGIYYGGDAWIEDGETWEGPEHFKAAYRHVVDRVRARGATNIKWRFHTNNYSYPLDTWNFAPAYYPSPDYVDWLGLSVYGQQFKDEPNPGIGSLVDWPYQEMCGLDPKKPIMIAEWATGEFPHSIDEHGGIGKAEGIKQAVELFRVRYPGIKAAVYWHERWQNPNQSYSNLRVNSSVESLNAYREGVAHPDWLGNLTLRALRKTK